MTTFSNPATGATAASGRYVSALLEVLGDRDPFAVQEELPAALRAAVAGLDAGILRRPEGPEKWSVIQVVGHLADTELVYGYRMRMIVAQPGSPIAGYDQDLWASGLGYERLEPEETIHVIETLRTANLRWLRDLTGEELEREGVHAERGPESVITIVRLLAAHDLVHRRQIERIKRAVGAG